MPNADGSPSKFDLAMRRAGLKGMDAYLSDFRINVETGSPLRIDVTVEGPDAAVAAAALADDWSGIDWDGTIGEAADDSPHGGEPVQQEGPWTQRTSPGT